MRNNGEKELAIITSLNIEDIQKMDNAKLGAMLKKYIESGIPTLKSISLLQLSIMMSIVLKDLSPDGIEFETNDLWMGNQQFDDYIFSIKRKAHVE